MVQPYFPVQPTAPLLPYSLEPDVPTPRHEQPSGFRAASRQPLVLSAVTDALVPLLLPPTPSPISPFTVPTGSPSRGGDVMVYVLYQTSLPTLLFCSSVCFHLYSPFTCILLHKFSRQLSTFSLSSSGLVSALLVLSTIYLFMKVSLSPDLILCG